MVRKRLSTRQLEVIDELVAGGMSERVVLRKYNVGRRLFVKWLADEMFVQRFRDQIEFVKLQAEAMIARSMSAAGPV